MCQSPSRPNTKVTAHPRLISFYLYLFSSLFSPIPLLSLCSPALFFFFFCSPGQITFQLFLQLFFIFFDIFRWRNLWTFTTNLDFGSVDQVRDLETRLGPWVDFAIARRLLLLYFLIAR
ncbi:uncharacterized protein LOC114316935 [Camellia sinensis]|uniref:uncharacterized protein LOC114316935 n=1 Tax=Camellia sinensis TaxID=4442 RepID=UPI001036AC49|nr:uncharacterized protein LOC114316935 [Camellia sinensis]